MGTDRQWHAAKAVSLTRADYQHGPNCRSTTSLVLVVEDDPSVQTTLRATLTLVGYMTRAADSVESALTVVGSEHFDAVTFDVRLPDPKAIRIVAPRVPASDGRVCDDAGLIFTGMPMTEAEESLARATRRADLL